jgi:hypothetical protein
MTKCTVERRRSREIRRESSLLGPFEKVQPPFMTANAYEKEFIWMFYHT